MPPDPPDQHAGDLHLAQEAVGGSTEAQATIAQRFECIPRIIANRNTRFGGHLDATDLEDVSQDVAAIAWGRLKDFEGRAAIETWVYRICTLELMNAVRRKMRQKVRTVANGEDTDLAWIESDANSEPAHLRFEGLYKGMEMLEPGEAQVLRLKHYDNKTFEAIGLELGMSTSGAKHQYYKALSRLKGLLSATGDTPDDDDDQ